MIQIETIKDEGQLALIRDQIPPKTATSVDRMVENVRVNMQLGLPEFRICKPHEREFVLFAGGPSLNDTYQDRPKDAIIGTVNKSLLWAREKNIKAHFCGVMDPGAHMTKEVPAYKKVCYLLASIVDPQLVKNIVGRGAPLQFWHPLGHPEVHKEFEGKMGVGGGSTMGVRWITLAYLMGFRRIHLHGLDSSFRGKSTHAYPDRRDSELIEGMNTNRSFAEQIHDFIQLTELFEHEQLDLELVLYGEGLLQSVWDKTHAAYDRKHVKVERKRT